LLQVLDDGRLTDNKGRVVNFKNTIIIMTSNLGSDLIRENFENVKPENLDEVMEKTRMQVFELLKKTIRPEFLNRVDELIMFTPLNPTEIRQIVALQIDQIRRMLESNGVSLQLTDNALDFIAEEGYHPEFGARPVKRVIQRFLLNELSRELLAGKIQSDKPVLVDENDGLLTFSN
jgi:ATP-dependent Clp protease ATP-binding subunit ClpB